MSNALQLVDENSEAILNLDRISEKCGLTIAGEGRFSKAVRIANTIAKIRAALTPEVMAPIMSLAGSKLGFKCDKPDYPAEVIRDCVIEATIQGLPVAGNNFNIIAKQCYITKEGLGYLLSKIPNLKYVITTGIPKVVSQGAEAPVHIEWRIVGGEKQEKDMSFPIRVNAGMGADAINGKAVRKARAWLYMQVTGMEIADGDSDDANAVQKKTIKITSEEAVKAPELPASAETQSQSPFPLLEKALEGTGVTLKQMVEWHEANNWTINETVLVKQITSAVESCRQWMASVNNN